MSRVAAVNDILEIKVYYYQGNQLAVNSLGYKVTAISGGGGLTNKQTCQAFNTLVVDKVLAILAAPALFLGSGCINHTTPKAKEENSNFGGDSGHDAGEPLPKQTSIIVKKLTDTPGPSGQGRIFLPFFGEGDNGPDSKPIDATLAAIRTYTATIFNSIFLAIDFGEMTLAPMLLRRVNYDTSRPITGNFVAARWSTQRRRSDYGKTNARPDWS